MEGDSITSLLSVGLWTSPIDGKMREAQPLLPPKGSSPWEIEVYEEANKREHAHMSHGAHTYERASVSLRNESLWQGWEGFLDWRDGKGREYDPKKGFHVCNKTTHSCISFNYLITGI